MLLALLLLSFVDHDEVGDDESVSRGDVGGGSVNLLFIFSVTSYGFFVQFSNDAYGCLVVFLFVLVLWCCGCCFEDGGEDHMEWRKIELWPKHREDSLVSYSSFLTER